MTAAISIISNYVETPISQIGNLVAHDGWGMAPLHRLSESGALQQGSTDRGYKLESRFGKFVFKLGTSNMSAMYQARAAIMSYFSPDRLLKVKFDVDGLVKVIEGHYADDMSLPWAGAGGSAQNFVVTLECNDPTFYDPDIKWIAYVGGGSTGFVVNVVVPMKFGQAAFSTSQIVNNIGDADSYPLLSLTGPLEDPVITNTTYGEKLDFTGTHIAAGVTYEIDARYGYKTVVELPSTDRLSTLSNDSDLSTFRLRRGSNDIRVVATGITSASIVYVKYYHRYLGV